MTLCPAIHLVHGLGALPPKRLRMSFSGREGLARRHHNLRCPAARQDFDIEHIPQSQRRNSSLGPLAGKAKYILELAVDDSVGGRLPAQCAVMLQQEKQLARWIGVAQRIVDCL